MPVVVSTIDDHPSDVSHTQGGPFNDAYTTQSLHWGTHKSGLPQEPLLIFKNLNIPAGSTIISASIEQQSINVTAVATGSFNGRIALLTPDGKWDASSLPVGWTESISDDDWHVELLDVVTQLVIVGVAAQAGAGITVAGDIGTVVQRIAQGTLITAAGDITIARVALGGSFTPGVGNIWIELYDDSSGLPGTLLATSATRPIGDIVFKLWNQLRPTYDFVFSAPEQITVAINDLIHVVLRTDTNSTIGPHIGTFRYNYAGGDLAPYGISPAGGYDTQNYLTIDDLSGSNKIPTSGPTIAWVIPTTLGLQTTPDIATLLQNHIDSVGYSSSGKIGFRYERVSSGGGIIYAGFGHATAMLAELTVDYTEPTIVVPPAGALILTGFAPVAILTINQIGAEDMNIIFPKKIDTLIIPDLQELDFRLDKLKDIELPDPITIVIEEFKGLEPVAPSKEVERISFLYADFANTIQNVLDGKIAELTNEVKPYEVEVVEWARGKEDILEDDEEAVERSFDDEASKGFLCPSGVFNKDISRFASKMKKKLSRLSEALFSTQNNDTTANITAGLEAGNQAENIVRTTDEQRQTINLNAAQFLVEVDFRVFQVHVENHNAKLEVQRIKHEAYVAELRGQLLQLQEREIAIKGYTLTLLERTKQVEMFQAAVDYLNAQQLVKQIELENFVLQTELEKNKLLKFQAEVDKFSSLINLNISKFNLYKAGINFEESKVDVYREEAEVAEAQIQLQEAKTTSGRITSDTKLTVARANLQAQVEKLRAARDRLDTALVEAQSVKVGFAADLLFYQAQLRDFLVSSNNDTLGTISETEASFTKQTSTARQESRRDLNETEFTNEGVNIKDLADLNAEAISESADIAAKTNVTSKLVHTLAGGS